MDYLIVLILLDMAGVFGRGPVSKAHAATLDGALSVSYERVARTGTPSNLMVKFGNTAIKGGQIHLWASEDLVTKLGNKLIAPQPATSTVGNGGLQYSFPATNQPAEAVFSLQPSAPGVFNLTFRVEGSSDLHLRILVMP